MQYTVDYFIEKFSAIPEENWTTGTTINHKGQKCALGHCGVGVDELENLTDEAFILTEILKPLYKDHILTLGPWEIVTNINDRHSVLGTPKQRILTALQTVKSQS